MKAKILLMYAMPYSIKESGRDEVEGVTLQYYFWGEKGETLAPKEYLDGIDKTIGMQRAKSSVDFALRKKLVTVPAIYEGEFEMTVGSDGKPVQKLTDIDYVCDVRIEASTPFDATKSEKAPADTKK